MANNNFTGVVNIPSQIPVLNAASLSANNATITDLTVTDLTVDNTLSVEGIILTSSGTSDNPSYSFTSDTDTGMYIAGTNALCIQNHTKIGSKISFYLNYNNGVVSSDSEPFVTIESEVIDTKIPDNCKYRDTNDQKCTIPLVTKIASQYALEQIKKM
jgi:hypothetical protein